MTEATDDDNGPIKIYRHLSDETARLMRLAIADLGFPPHCSFKACRRSRTCATRYLLCWQVNHEEINRLITLSLAHRWKEGPKPGEEWPEWEPEQIRKFERVLAEEAGEDDPVRDMLVAKLKGNTP